MVNSLLLGTLHTDVLVLNAGLERTLLARCRDQSNWRGVDVIIVSFWNLKLYTVICPGVDVVVSIKYGIWL